MAIACHICQILTKFLLIIVQTLNKNQEEFCQYLAYLLSYNHLSDGFGRTLFETGSFKNQNYGRFMYDVIQSVRTLKIFGA